MINEMILKFIIGGSLISIISLISKCKYPYISGLFMMFPAVTLIGYYFVSTNVTPAELKNITAFSFVSLVTVAVFIMSFYYFQTRMTVFYSLGCSLVCWLLVGFVIVIIKHYSWIQYN